jgi:DHA1 family bicyclomycin/chloramphenicol resistance-like MFS transporter
MHIEAARAERPETSLIFLLGGLIALAPLSIDIYLPSLPDIGATFGADPGRVQLTLASYFLGMALGQTLYGPLTDRFGRKRPLYVGLVLFILASVGCALAPSIGVLIALRFVQAVGVCSGQVVVRAIVRDLFETREAVRIFSLLLLVLGVSPVLAPLIGAQIIRWFPWRAVFWTLAGAGAVGLAASAIRLPETHRSDAAHSLHPGKVAAAFGRLLRDRGFLGYTLAGSTGMAGMFAYIVSSSFVFIELFHVRQDRFGLIFGANALGMILTAQVNVRLLRRFEMRSIIGWALAVQTVTGIALTVAAFGNAGLYTVAALLFVYVSSVGCLTPNTTAMAMARAGRSAGSASALIGTLQFSIAAIGATAVGSLADGTARPMAAVVGACGVTGLLIYRFVTTSET